MYKQYVFSLREASRRKKVLFVGIAISTMRTGIVPVTC